MLIVSPRELFTGTQTGGGPDGTGTTDGSGVQASPLGWNPARRKPRSIWRSGFAGPGPVAPTVGLSAMIVGTGASVRARTGRAVIYQVLRPAGMACPPLRGLSIRVRRRSTAGRVWMPEVAAHPPQLPPLPPVRPVAARRRWRPGRSEFRGLPTAVAPAPHSMAVAVARGSRRGSPGFASPLRFATSIARPLSPPRATLTPTARPGHAPRPPVGPLLLQSPFRVPPPHALPGLAVACRGGDDAARRRAGGVYLGRLAGIAFSGKLHYNIYGNVGSGEPVDYAGPIGAVMATSWMTPGLVAPGIWSFGVRAADVNGEEQNLDCAVTIVLDASGNDITCRPAPPVGLRAFPLAGGTVRVEWHSPPARGASAPTGFNVYLGPGASPDYATPASVVSSGSGIFNTFVADLSGLTDGTAYSIGVRAFNANGEEANTTSVGVIADATGPRPVDLLVATAIV